MRLAFPLLAGTLAVAGGIFFGLFSCGGYLWHEQLFGSVFATALLGTLVLPPSALERWPFRGGFVISALTTFIVARAVASAFYPGPPTSLATFARAVLSGLLGTSC